jgi:hypothetical protein
MLEGGQAPISVDSRLRAFARLWAILRPAAAKLDHKSVEGVWFLIEVQETPTRAQQTSPPRQNASGGYLRKIAPARIACVLAKAVDGFSVPIESERDASAFCFDAFSLREPGFSSLENALNTSGTARSACPES